MLFFHVILFHKETQNCLYGEENHNVHFDVNARFVHAATDKYMRHVGHLHLLVPGLPYIICHQYRAHILNQQRRVRCPSCAPHAYKWGTWQPFPILGDNKITSILSPQPKYHGSLIITSRQAGLQIQLKLQQGNYENMKVLQARDQAQVSNLSVNDVIVSETFPHKWLMICPWRTSLKKKLQWWH